jgi:outer membrane biosynthesis protein TonB
MSRYSAKSVGRKATRIAVTVAAATALAASASIPAFADETDPVVDEIVVGTEPPAEPEEDVFDVPEEEVTQEPGAEPDEEPELPLPSKPTDKPDGEYCDPAKIYTPKTKGSKYHKGVGPTLSNYNGTSRTARSTFTSEVTGTVGVSVTAGLAVSVDVMLAKIEGKYDVNLSASLTAKLGNNIAVDTPSKTTTNAKYGVYRLKNTGVSYRIYDNCQTSAKKTVTSYSPMKVGWYLWES